MKKYMGHDPDCELDIYFELPSELFFDVYDAVGATEKIIECGSVQTLPHIFANDIIRTYANKRKLKFCDTRKMEYTKKLSRSKKCVCPQADGIFILPPDKEIIDYTPIQYPEDISQRKIAHFDCHILQDTLLKMNLNMNDSYSMLYKIENAAGINADQISLSDKETMTLINNCDTDGIPEFEIKNAREIIQAIKPQKFDDLIKILGILHGVGVWTYNGEFLFENGIKFSDIIAFRDEVMLTLMKYGVNRKNAYMISERVRKGKGLTEKQYDELFDMGLPIWFLSSCEKVKYLCPKAHAAEIARISFLLAYFKAHYRAVFEKIAAKNNRCTEEK